MPRRPRRGGLLEWLSQSRLPIFVVDSRRVVLYFNRGCEELTGWPAADLIGQKCEWRSDGEFSSPEAMLSALCPPIASQAAVHRVHLVKRDGQTIDRIVRFWPLDAEELGVPSDEPMHWLGVMESLPLLGMVSATKESELHAELTAVKSQLRKKYSLGDVVATGAAMRQIMTRLQLAAASQVTVAFQGPPGTGKEHLARAVHYASEHRTRAFIPVDCRLSRSELETILKPLTTPQRDSESVPVLRPGVVYLQGVERLPAELQKDIVEHLNHAPTPSIRWMIASVSPLSDLVDREILLPEFRHLLAVIEVSLPALRHRMDEFHLLAQQALETCNQGEHQIQGFSPEVWEQFQAYNWPGNLDELFSVIRQAHAKCQGPVIAASDLPFQFRAGRDAQSIAAFPAMPRVPLEERLMQVERDHLVDAMSRAQGNKQLAAELLGIPRPKLYRRLEAHGLLNSPVAELP